MSTVTLKPAHELTSRQRRVFASISHYYEALAEPVPAAYVARKLEISRVTVLEHFRKLYESGWLRTPGSPTVPTRELPPHT